MASKMLVDRSRSTPEVNRDVCYCVPCAMVLSAGTGVVGNVELVHETNVGPAICCRCETPIAELPEPDTFACQVTLLISALLHMDVSSPNEAKTWLMKSFQKEGIEVVSYQWTDETKSFTVRWKFL